MKVRSFTKIAVQPPSRRTQTESFCYVLSYVYYH